MKRSKKRLPNKANFSTFYNLIALILGSNCVIGLELPKTVKESKSERVRGELKAKKCLQRQSFTKYLRLTLVFM